MEDLIRSIVLAFLLLMFLLGIALIQRGISKDPTEPRDDGNNL